MDDTINSFKKAFKGMNLSNIKQSLLVALESACLLCTHWFSPAVPVLISQFTTIFDAAENFPEGDPDTQTIQEGMLNCITALTNLPEEISDRKERAKILVVHLENLLKTI